ncbi:hypothetical protein P3W24_14040 [Luteibacter sp. PPL201]|uniref:Uncharacterized protein n=1 Tax=Luteibacter sahnii TaxID=3021977 RepID=A0ABT6BD88_9GAMM
MDSDVIPAFLMACHVREVEEDIVLPRGAQMVLMSFATYPSVHAWLIDDTKIVVP